MSLQFNYAVHRKYADFETITYIHFPYKWAIAAGIPHPDETPKMVNPCCGMSLQKGVKIIAVISLLWSVALIAEEIIIVAVIGCNGITLIKAQNPEFGDIHGPAPVADLPPPKLHKDEGKYSKNIAIKQNQTTTPKNEDYNIEEETLADRFKETTPICQMKLSEVVVSVVWVLTWIGDIALAVILIYGAYRKSTKLCKIWFHIRCAILVFRIVFLIIYAIGGLPMLYKIPVAVLCLFRIYSLWLVSHFIDEIKHEKEAKQNPRVSVANATTPRTDLEKFASQENTVVPPPGLTLLW